MKKENNAIVITSIISGVVLLIALLAMFSFSNASPSTDVVTVNGMSTIKATPDLITVYFTIETNGTTSSNAKNAHDLILDKLKSNIVDNGFEETDLKTESFNIYPNTYWDGKQQRQNGYKAYHSLKIELSVDQLDKLTSLVDAGVNAGAGISYINFELTQESQNKYKAQALKEASEDAQTKADAVASGFGKEAGKLVSVSVSDFGYYPWNVYTSRGTGIAEDSATVKVEVANIQPSEQEISASVSATFRLQ